MQQQTIEAPRYSEARENGTVTQEDSYHQPGSGPRGHPRCGCSLDTDKGAYRDVTVEMPDGRTVYFYHHSPVVVEQDGRYRLDSCGYMTSTTKERINRRLPYGFRLYQEDFEWYIKVFDPDAGYHDQDAEILTFEDGMVIEP